MGQKDFEKLISALDGMIEDLFKLIPVTNTAKQKNDLAKLRLDGDSHILNLTQLVAAGDCFQILRRSIHRPRWIALLTAFSFDPNWSVP